MKNFRQHMSNIHPCLLEYLDSISKHDSAHDLIMKYGGPSNLNAESIGAGGPSYEETVDISKIPNFVDALTSGKLTLTLVKDDYYVRESLINHSTFVKTGKENLGNFHKHVFVDNEMKVFISCNNVYADNAKLLVEWKPIV